MRSEIGAGWTLGEIKGERDLSVGRKSLSKGASRVQKIGGKSGVLGLKSRVYRVTSIYKKDSTKRKTKKQGAEEKNVRGNFIKADRRKPKSEGCLHLMVVAHKTEGEKKKVEGMGLGNRQKTRWQNCGERAAPVSGEQQKKHERSTEVTED